MFDDAKEILRSSPDFFKEAEAMEAGNEKEYKIIKEFKQSKAFQRLKHRQVNAVKRIERIKESFERKR